MNPTRAYLLFAGAIGVIVGTGLTFSPSAIHSTTGIVLGNDPNLLSEMRGAGGAALLAGMFILAGTFRSVFAYAALWISVVIYLGYGTGRVLSIMTDGQPAVLVMVIAAFELLIGLTGVMLLRKHNRTAAY